VKITSVLGVRASIVLSNLVRQIPASGLSGLCIPPTVRGIEHFVRL
jgi:hypothetical protein